jgi:hypothetical protein
LIYGFKRGKFEESQAGHFSVLLDFRSQGIGTVLFWKGMETMSANYI